MVPNLNHPGVVVSGYFRGIPQDQVAEMLDVSRKTVNSLFRGRQRISPTMAIRLAAITGRHPEYWLELQMKYDLAEIRSSTNDANRDVSAKYRSLQKIGSRLRDVDALAAGVPPEELQRANAAFRPGPDARIHRPKRKR